jgi:hypothetical protein
MAKLPPNPLVSEVLRAAHGAKTVEKKVELLAKHKRDDIKAILIWNFDKAIRSNLPAGDVPYQPNETPAGRLLLIALSKFQIRIALMSSLLCFASSSTFFSTVLAP